MLVIYSNLKKITEKTAKILSDNFKCDKYIIDYPDVDIQDIKNLKAQGIKSYYRTKLYSRPSIFDIEKDLMNAQLLGFDGYALDLEACSKSDIWQKDAKYADLFGRNLNVLISKYFKDIIIYPENLGGEKYKYYDIFIEQLKDLDLTFLIERTYEVWKPWELYKYYRLNKKRYNKFAMGVWFDSMNFLHGQPDWLKDITKRFVPMIQFIQSIFINMFDNVFYYTERPNSKEPTFVTDNWQQTLMMLRKYK